MLDAQMAHGLQIAIQVQTGASRPASDTGTKMRVACYFAFRTAALSVPSVLVSCWSSAGNTEGEPSEEMHQGGKLSEMRGYDSIRLAIYCTRTVCE